MKTKDYNLLFKSKTDKEIVSGDKLCDLYGEWAEKYNINSIEDPFDQSDFDNYAKFY